MEIAIRFRTLTVWYWHQTKFVNEIPKDCLKCYMITRRWVAAFFRSLTSQPLSRLNCIVLWYRTNIFLRKRNTCIWSCIAVIKWLFNWLLLKVFHSAIDTDTMKNGCQWKKKSHEHRGNLFYDVIIGQLNYTLILQTWESWQKIIC